MCNHDKCLIGKYTVRSSASNTVCKNKEQVQSVLLLITEIVKPATFSLVLRKMVVMTYSMTKNFNKSWFWLPEQFIKFVKRPKNVSSFLLFYYSMARYACFDCKHKPAKISMLVAES